MPPQLPAPGPTGKARNGRAPAACRAGMGYLDFRRFFLVGAGVAAFAAAFCCLRISADIRPRAAPAQALAALSHRLSRGFFFPIGFGIGLLR